MIVCYDIIIRMYLKTVIIENCNLLQAVFAKDLLPNVLKCHRKLLNDVVSNFPSNLEEITLIVSPCQVCFKTYVEGDENQLLKTEMKLNPDEFDDFQVLRIGELLLFFK